MKLHFTLTVLAYFYFGIGMSVMNFGIKAGIGFWPCQIIWVTSVLFLLVVSLTSMQKVKDKLYKEDEIKFDFETKKPKP